MNKREVNAVVESVRRFVDSVDTPKEVRATVGYLFLTGLYDRLVELGMPESVSARASARVHVNLPADFRTRFPEAFAELIRLYAKQMFALWKTCVVDWDDDIYEDIYLSLVSTMTLDA